LRIGLAQDCQVFRMAVVYFRLLSPQQQHQEHCEAAVK
jgi:hypothetical protein